MKKLICSLLALLLLVSLGGCGVKEKIEEKAAGEAAEKFIEGMGGGDIDIDGDKVTIKGEDGGDITIGGTDWPDSELAKAIPEFTKGEISAVMNSEDGVLITVDNVEQADYESYLESIKKDFDTDAFETSSEDYYSYGASNADGLGVLLQYGDSSLSITVTKPTE